MKRELLQSDYRSTEQPHFDEEWTLLSARPVVPLKSISTSQTKRRTVKLLALFAAALMFGAASALVVVSFERSRAVQPALTDSNHEQSPPASQAEATIPVEGNLPESTASPEVAPVAAVTAPKAVAVVRVKTKASERQIEDKSSSASPAEAEKEAEEGVESSRQSRAVLFDELKGGRWEERRARRIRRQERRERSGRNGRDLLRIGEIFEGPRP